MWQITTIKDTDVFGGFDEVVFTGEWDDMRKAWFRLTKRHGNIFRYQPA